MGLKAYVKINVSIHLEDPSIISPTDADAVKSATRLNETIKYPLAVNHYGAIGVEDKAEAERVMVMLSNHVKTTFMQMGVVSPPAGTHKPDLALAMGGDQEPAKEVA